MSREKCHQDFDQGCFARTVWTDQCVDRSCWDIEIEVAERLDVTEPLTKVLCSNCGIHLLRPPRLEFARPI